jgi:hypothetical protein
LLSLYGNPGKIRGRHASFYKIRFLISENE